MKKLNPKLSLSKSRYTRGLQCNKSLWLRTYKPEVLTPADALTQSIFEQGNVVGDLACGLFPGGKEVPFNPDDYVGMEQLTKQWLSEGVKDIYEATFNYDGVLALVDIFHQKEDGRFEIYEVKSSTWSSSKSIVDIEKYVHDASIQYYVLNGLGFDISDTYITLVNKDYTRGSKLDIKQLFSHVKVTQEVLNLQSQIPSTLENFREDLKDTDNEPNIDIGTHCKKPYKCDAYDYCWKTQRSIPDYSVFNIFNTNHKSLNLYKEGIINVEDIPEGSISTENQRFYIDVWKDKKNFIDKEAIKRFIGTISYPIYHLDFETLAPAIPQFKGASPSTSYPFQYSLHIENEDGSLQHKELLVEPGKDPREEVAKRLAEDIPKDSCILAYSASVEKGVIEKLANLYPAYREHLTNLSNNFIDLRRPFLDRYFCTPEMKKLTGLKTVLPILVPEKKNEYKELDLVHDGGEAMNIYKKLGEAVAEEADLEIINRYRKSLLAYCRQDTKAMVDILRKLKQLTL